MAAAQLRQWLAITLFVCAVRAASAAPPQAEKLSVMPMPALGLGQPQVADATPGLMRLTLDEAKHLALNNNKALTLARLNTQEKFYAKAGAQTFYLPRIIGSSAYVNFNNDLGSIITTRARSFGPINIASKTANLAVFNQNSSISGVTALQPITKLIAIHAAVEIAKADESIAHAQLEKGVRDVASGVTQIYYGLLGAQRIEQALALQLKMGKQVFAVKPDPNIRVMLIEVEKGLLETRGKIAELTEQFNDLLDLPLCTVLELVEPLPAPLPVGCADDAVRMALLNNPQLQEADATIGKAHAALRVAKSSFLPDVNVLGGFYNQTVMSYVQNDFALVGVIASYDFEWGNKFKVKRQRETMVDMAHQNLQVTIDKITLEVRKSFHEYEQARQALALANDNVKAHLEVEQTIQNLAALAAAKAETAKAELAVIQAELDYRLAHAKLANAIGKS